MCVSQGAGHVIHAATCHSCYMEWPVRPSQGLTKRGPPEEGLANHCSILAWRIPWTEEPGGLQ